MELAGLDAMLGSSWDGLALRLCGAAAVALGFHAWRQLQRPRAGALAQEDASGASQPLLLNSEEAEVAGKGAKDGDTAPAPDRPGVAPAVAAAAATLTAATQQQEEGQFRQDEAEPKEVQMQGTAAAAEALPAGSAAPAAPAQGSPPAIPAAQHPAAAGRSAVEGEEPQPAERAEDQLLPQQGQQVEVQQPSLLSQPQQGQLRGHGACGMQAGVAEQAAAEQAAVQQLATERSAAEPGASLQLQSAGGLVAAPAAEAEAVPAPAAAAAPAVSEASSTVAAAAAEAVKAAQAAAEVVAAAQATERGVAAAEVVEEMVAAADAAQAGVAAGAAGAAATEPAAAVAAAEAQAEAALVAAPEPRGAAAPAQLEELESDPSDVAAIPLGSPFVPPSLAAGATGAAAATAIPLFSTFVPTPPLQPAPVVAGTAGEDPAPAEAGELAFEAAPAVSSSDGSGGSPEGRFTHKHSLLALGLDQQQPGGSAKGLGAVREQQQALGELAASEGAVAAAGEGATLDAVAAQPSGPPPAGRPSGLRIELPFDPAEASLPGAASAAESSLSSGVHQQPDLQQSQQGGEPAASLSGSSRSATPPGFDLQQQQVAAAAAAAAAAAEYFAVPPALPPGRGGGSAGGPAVDSVAAALQRAVELAASGAPVRPGTNSFAGFQTAPGGMGGGGGYPGGAYNSAGYASAAAGVGGAGHHPGMGNRSALSGGTFRAATAPAPIVHHSVGIMQPPAGGDSAWGDSLGFSMLAERSSSLTRERHLPRLSEEEEGIRASVDIDVPLACKLDVVAGPCSNASYTNTEDVLEIIIGRNQGVTMQLNDGEVSGQHAAVRWSSVDKCWKVADLGSLNGTLLNGEPISVPGRKRGRDYRLSSDDILQLGSFTKVKVSTFPRDLLDPLQSRCGSLPVGSMPRSLTMPKHRIPSFTSLLSPKITNTPSKKATVAAASDELRLECCIISRTGRDHQRKGQTCEDVACAECPLHGSEAALEGSPAALFCVFDGHCGRGAADAASTALPDEVSSRLEGVRGALAEAAGAEDMLRQAFLATDEAISAEEGCTATAVLMWRDGQGAVCLQAANVGDSAALFIDPSSGEGIELTEDHRLTNPRERQRLQDMGIQLASNARRLYGLNLCRGLGDKFLKDEDLGLSAEPYVSGVVRLTEEQGGVLLIASDGLWDVTDMETVTAAVCQADREKDGSVLETTNAVIAHALKQRTKDDVTALVVRVWPASEWELRSPTKNLDDGEAAAFVSYK